jgi:hypothetical protein
MRPELEKELLLHTEEKLCRTEFLIRFTEFQSSSEYWVCQ